MDDIVILSEPIDPATLRRLAERFFGDMVKLVVDVERRWVAVGGELHADAERMLLARGSRQGDLWGANDFPGRGPDRCLEFTALINIRPSQDNRSMEVGDPVVRRVMAEVVAALVGRGEAL